MRKIVVSISAGALFLCGSAIGVTGAGASSDSKASGAGASGGGDAKAAQVRGRRGPRGRRGRRGLRGFTGPLGPVGPGGPTGATGAQGAQGLQGIQGPQGEPGDPGGGGGGGDTQINFRSAVSGVSLASTPFANAYVDPNGGFIIQAKCADQLATPQMQSRVLGQEDDGILEGTVFEGGAIDSNVTPGSDGDIDNGDGIGIGATMTGNEVKGLTGVYADNDNTATGLQAVLRTKTSTGSTPTQGSCAFVGVATAVG